MYHIFQCSGKNNGFYQSQIKALNSIFIFLNIDSLLSLPLFFVLVKKFAQASTRLFDLFQFNSVKIFADFDI